MNKAEYNLKMFLGWACYVAVLLWPLAYMRDNKIFLWLLSWAGFYTYDTGYEEWLQQNKQEN